MSQSVLDPNDTSSQSANVWKPTKPIPNDVRSFGFCVDFDQLLPGDLILVSSLAPNFISNAIRRVQSIGGYSPEDARWEHAAVYIGSETICESDRNGVQVKSIYSYIGKYKIRVKRNINLTPDQRWNLVVFVLIQKSYSYGYFSIFNLLLKSFKGYWTHQGSPINFSYPTRSVYCSQLYADAHVKASGIPLGNLTSGEATPASLSLDAALSDVLLSWVKIS